MACTLIQLGNAATLTVASGWAPTINALNDISWVGATKVDPDGIITVNGSGHPAIAIKGLYNVTWQFVPGISDATAYSSLRTETKPNEASGGFGTADVAIQSMQQIFANGNPVKFGSGLINYLNVGNIILTTFGYDGTVSITNGSYKMRFTRMGVQHA